MQISYVVSTMLFWGRENPLSFEQECEYLKSMGFGIELWPTLRDQTECRYERRNWDRIRAGLEQGADLFLTSGGVSVGDFDVVKEDPALNGTSARAGRDPGGCEPPASRGAGASGDAGLAGT